MPSISEKISSYIEVTKPGIILGNAITATAGYALAVRTHFDIFLYTAMLIGLSLVIAAGCVLNNYIDRNADIQMVRTKNRPLVRKVISPQQALAYSILLLLLGTAILMSFTNLLTTGITLFGFVAYVLVYSFVKYLTVHATFIGTFAGAVPPVVGYCAMSGELNQGAWLVFLFLITWQMPHFFAISIYRLHEYKKASIPVHPLIRGVLSTKIQMLLYIFAFTYVCTLLVSARLVNTVFLICAMILASGWVFLSLRGFVAKSDTKWAYTMFKYSLWVITILSFVIPFTS